MRSEWTDTLFSTPSAHSKKTEFMLKLNSCRVFLDICCCCPGHSFYSSIFLLDTFETEHIFDVVRCQIHWWPFSLYVSPKYYGQCECRLLCLCESERMWLFLFLVYLIAISVRLDDQPSYSRERTKKNGRNQRAQTPLAYWVCMFVWVSEWVNIVRLCTIHRTPYILKRIHMTGIFRVCCAQCSALYTWFTHPYTLPDYFHFQVSFFSPLFLRSFYMLFISFTHFIIINL